MALALLVGLSAVGIIFLLYLKWLKVSSFWAKRNVPHSPPHVFFGSLGFLQKKNPAQWMQEQYMNFKKSPYFGIWLFWRPALVVNSPEIARRILVKDADNFRDRFLSSGKTDPIGNLNIFVVNEPIWSSVRRRITSVFTTAKIKTFVPMFNNKAKELSQRINSLRDVNKVKDTRDVITDYTTDVIGTAAFGVECNGTLTGDCAMRRVTRDFQEFNFFRGIAHTCIFFVPQLVDIFRVSFFPKAAAEYFRKIFLTVVEQRGGFDKTMEETRDLVDALIKIKQEANKNSEPMSLDLLTAQGAIFVQAGFETAASTITFTLYELAYVPEAQEKLYQELIEIKEKLDGKDFDLESLANATYLNCVMKETLRKYPPMGWLDRVASKEYKIDENLTIPAGTPVYVNASGMQMDPDYFPEPEKFIPERFLPENEKNIHPFTYLPFGEGPRNCIGRRFAYQTFRFAVAELIMNYEVRPRAEMPKPNDCELEKYGLLLTPGQIISVDFVPRSGK